MEEKYKGILTYLLGWIGGLIVLFGLKENTKLTKFHACQAITLGVTSNVIWVLLGFIPFVNIIAYIIVALIFVLQIIGAIRAYNEEEFEIPVISDLTRNIFKKQLDEE